ncbi:hypothetical protein LCGC14_0903740 [marine sediment metagenome]|uniref:Polynucleotide kinase PNKP phosphatase domain-containing protein n=1 Tax=marine sediment metagenome TaxID=412755 RepID=A0A0F9P0C5_9ZZZZ
MSKTPIIICDIDGTIAKRKNREPYEYDKIETDTPIKPVIDCVKALSICNAAKVYFVSGREGTPSCKAQTIYWINKHFDWEKPYNYELFMRKVKDYRKDSIVKREIYDEVIAGNFNVIMVFDDRDQMVNMWRKDLGLICLQTNYGDF